MAFNNLSLEEFLSDVPASPEAKRRFGSSSANSSSRGTRDTPSTYSLIDLDFESPSGASQPLTPSALGSKPPPSFPASATPHLESQPSLPSSFFKLEGSSTAAIQNSGLESRFVGHVPQAGPKSPSLHVAASPESTLLHSAVEARRPNIPSKNPVNAGLGLAGVPIPRRNLPLEATSEPISFAPGNSRERSTNSASLNNYNNSRVLHASRQQLAPNSKRSANPRDCNTNLSTRSALVCAAPPSREELGQIFEVNPSQERQGPQIHESGPEKPTLSENSGFVGFFKGLFTRDELTCQKGEIPTQITFTKFVVNMRDTPTLVTKWIAGKWFSPGRILENLHIEPPQQHLIPFWIFSASTMTTAIGKCAYHKQVIVDGIAKMEEEWKAGRCIFKNSFQNITLLAFVGCEEYAELLREFKCWKTDSPVQVVPSSRLPPGVTCHPALPWSEVWSEYTEKVIKKDLTLQAKKELLVSSKANRVRDIKTIVTYTALQKRLLYCPVYSGHYIYTKEQKRYRYLVHGQTGEVTGKRPYGLGSIGVAVEDALSDLFLSKNQPQNYAPPEVDVGGRPTGSN